MVLGQGGRRKPLFGVSVFARRPGVDVVQILARFDQAPAFLEARVSELRSAGFEVLPTGTNEDHFDLQLLAGRSEEDAGEPVSEVRVLAAQLGVDIVGDPHREDDDGFNWARLSDARRVEDVVPGSAVVLGSSIGRYLAKVVAWDFEVSDEDPIVIMELLPIRPSEVAKLLGRHRSSAA